jgi:glycolate oxidase FAD binding subunit
MMLQPTSTADQAVCHIDGFGPLPVVAPHSVTELADCVLCAAADQKAVYPLGGRTMLGLGLPPSKPGVAVDLRSLDHVIDYPARDMTITVQAGITIAKLQAILAAENQQLPVDVPMPEQATLGGAIAVNASGPRRYGYGTLRDYVIGISFVNGEGQEVKAGGRVVKNVAGYDLMKLHIGALGTLGIVTQVTLKLRPRPEASRTVVYGCETSALAGLLDRLSRSATRPISIELLDQGTAYAISNLLSDDRWSRGAPSIGLARYLTWAFLVGFEGNAQNVDSQVDELSREMGPGVLACDSSEANGIWRALVDIPLHRDIVLAFKANLLPSGVLDFGQLPRRWREGDPGILVHAGNGIAIGYADGGLTLDQARTMLTTLHDAAGPDGNVVVTRCPPEWKRELPIWGKPRGDVGLMRRVKEALDPRGVFNPGRFVDGI